MMMMMTRRISILIFTLLLSIAVVAQDKDFGIWYGVSASHDLSKKLELDISMEMRTFNNAAKIEEAFLEGGLSYNFNKYLSAGGSYRLSKSIEDNESYYFRHKIMLDLKGTLPVGNFSFSGRLRFQARSLTYIEDDKDEKPDYTGRFKLKAVYKTPVFPINPYVYVESFSPMFSDKTRTIEKIRYSAGLDFKIAKNHSVDLEYIFQRDYLPHVSDISIISVNYGIKF
jgi:hypothetical protein